MNKVIKVSNLSKRYRLGLKEKYADTLVGKISQIIRSPYDNLKRLRDLNRFGLEDDSVFWALKDVSFEVKEGEVLGIIGKNGAGKSTLLKILSQITEPTSGNIEIHGRVASLLEVGTGFHPELSGRENIYMNGTILGMTRREIDSKLDEIIDFSGVEKFIDTPVKFYSSGMKVRLGFSVAAHLDPEILIIDEVLAVGDYEFQKKCLGKMEDVSKNHGRTVLFVSHQMDAIAKLCDCALILEKGKCLERKDANEAVSIYFSSNFEGKQFKRQNFEKANKSGVFLSWTFNSNKFEQIVTNSHCEICVTFLCLSKMTNLEFGLIIKDVFGSIIYSANSQDGGKYLFSLDKGQYVFKINFFLCFKPQVYDLEFAINSDGVLKDHWVVKNSFEVLDDKYSVLNTAWKGVCSMHSSFSIE
ncbi:ABC transporter ATP-binding protein [Algoriphagus sp. NBT04N3]|uniref:ABC transporter ATP-binding protein n=1 Tax=Algoriphagus sp. NBT04N3 TaxID=2705473 RepID=UPI001C6344DD|nr:ABC transporter ATP-binding protein [Algoriphagus sp. NBT04N3]QYH38001.1 ABC transporter ATP-binding protein [Algoriphagus sp. NBT04N3]